MPRLFPLVSVLLVLATLNAAAVRAQDATPAAEEAGLPEGVTFAPLAQEVVEDLPPAPGFVGLARLTYAPGTGEDLEAGPGVGVAYVESGTLTLRQITAIRVTRVAVAGTPVAAEVAAAGVEFQVSPGDAFVVPPGAAGEIRNDGSEPAVLLVSFVFPAEDAAAATPGAATPVNEGTPPAAATPAAEGTPPAGQEDEAGISFEPLAFGTATDVPPAPAVLLLARVSLEPGASVPPPTEDAPGPDILYVEEGTIELTVAAGEVAVSPAFAGTPAAEEAGPPPGTPVAVGQEVTLEAGDYAFGQMGHREGVRNAGDEPATVLLLAILPAGLEAATPAS